MGTIYEYKILWATIYTSTRACGHNGGCGMCLTVPCSLSLVTWNTAPDHSALCGNVRVPAQQSAAWLLLGAAGQRSNPSVCCRLPGAVFHLSTPVRPSWCPNHPQSLQMLQLWNHQFHPLQSMTDWRKLYKEAEIMTEYSCLAIIQQQLCWSHLGVKS